MSLRITQLTAISFLLCLAVSGCATRELPPAELLPGAGTQTMEAAASLIAVMHQTPQPRAYPTPLIVTPFPSPTLENTLTPPVIHFFQPGDPPPHTSTLSDLSSALLAEEQRTIGDHFDINLYERPLTQDKMVYKDYLDIAPGAELSLAPPWVYVTIFLVGPPPKYAKVSYGVELDLNLDARGDWLILASAPASAEWATNGVRAYLDTNGDVGGATAMRADHQPQPGDGYDSMILGPGVSSDPDAAWARISPSDSSIIQIAFKHELIGGDKTFIWGAWADGGVVRPQWFDYNDHFTVEEAGSPIPISRYYPLQELALVDNTCRWVQGTPPRASMPGLCYFNTPVPTITLTPEATPTLP